MEGELQRGRGGKGKRERERRRGKGGRERAVGKIVERRRK